MPARDIGNAHTDSLQHFSTLSSRTRVTQSHARMLLTLADPSARSKRRASQSTGVCALVSPSSISPNPLLSTNEPTLAMEKTDPAFKNEQEHFEHRESSPQLVAGEAEIDEAKVRSSPLFLVHLFCADHCPRSAYEKGRLEAYPLAQSLVPGACPSFLLAALLQLLTLLAIGSCPSSTGRCVAKPCPVSQVLDLRRSSFLVGHWKRADLRLIAGSRAHRPGVSTLPGALRSSSPCTFSR